MKKVILIIIILSTLVGSAYYMGTRTNKEVEYITEVIDLTESQILEVQQKARLNWIPLDSAMTWLDGIEPIDRINWIDSTKWSFKDSLVLNIRDSINIIYIPFYEARDTIVHFDETVEEVRVQLSLAVKPRFFPTVERFLTSVQMRELIVTKPEEVDSWWKHRWTIGLGYGIMYYKSSMTTITNTVFREGDYNGNFNSSTTQTETEWRFDHGIQLGLYFRLF